MCGAVKGEAKGAARELVLQLRGIGVRFIVVGLEIMEICPGGSYPWALSEGSPSSSKTDTGTLPVIWSSEGADSSWFLWVGT